MPKQLGPEYKNVSLSHGTMIASDVFNAIEHLLPSKMVRSFWHNWNMYERWRGEDEEKSGEYRERAEYILNEDAWDYLNNIAPEGCYFGAHPGDGSDYGFWQGEE